jgi:hypothetical protein
MTSIQFTGVIELGDDNSGFPKGTRAEFVMTLLVRGNDMPVRAQQQIAVGERHLGPAFCTST